jgi:DNA-binding transcriptional MerR regulator
MSQGLRIGAVAERTGLRPGTIRAWQRRYAVLEPGRTDGGHRLYSEQDVEILSAVHQLERAGYALPVAVAEVHARVSRGLPADHEESRPAAPPPAPAAIAPEVDGADVEALLAAYTATRALLSAATPGAVVAALSDLVRALGGELGPAALEGAAVVPLDIGLGVTDPLLPRAEPFSVARMRIESLLPPLVEDARRVLGLLERAR